MAMHVDWLSKDPLDVALTRLEANQWAVHAMNGMGNTFLIIDALYDKKPFAPAPQDIRQLSQDWGRDQILAIRNGKPRNTLIMDIWNRDGSVAQNCGNGARCVAQLYYRQTESRGEPLPVTIHVADDVEIACDTNGALLPDGSKNVFCTFPIKRKPAACKAGEAIARNMLGDVLQSAKTVNLGNPHLVLHLQDNLQPRPLRELAQKHGAQLERQLKSSHIFPDGVNIGFASMYQPNALRLQVWERGAGITASCGTATIAAFATLATKSGARMSIYPALLKGEHYELANTTNAPDHIALSGGVEYERAGIVKC